MGWRGILYGALMWGICIYTFRRGGREERLAAGGILVASYLTMLVFLLFSPLSARFHHIEIPVMIVDTAFFFLLISISLRSQKFWPLWFVALSGLTILSHLAPFVHVLPIVYYNAAVLWSWPMLVILGVVVHRHHRRRS